MCSSLTSPSDSSLPALLLQPLRWHTLQVTFGAQLAQNWLALMSGQPQKKRIRTPLLRLQVECRKLMLQPPSNEPRHKLWLVK